MHITVTDSEGDLLGEAIHSLIIDEIDANKTNINVVLNPQFSHWDVNRDGKVDLLDLIVVGQNFDDSPSVDSRIDVNGDGRIDLADLMLVGQHLGEENETTLNSE